MVVDLFSGGAGGWCLGARSLGLDPIGIEWDGPSCRTRVAAGLRTIRADVATYPPKPFIGKVDGLCGSPPCQAFSSAGKRQGLADPRGQLVHEPMRWVRVIRPRWVALEQVPEVLGYWRWMVRELRTLGYSAWCGILNAADYGVPQVRNRAILLASLDRKAQPPAPTHSKTGHAEMFGDGRLPWVTMAEALGWGWETPSRVVCGERTPRWAYPGNPTTGRTLNREGQMHGLPSIDPAASPAPTVTGAVGKSHQWRWELVTPGRSYDAPPRRADPTTEPAPTVALGNNASAWCWERPSTTVQGDPRVAAPGHHEHTRDETSLRVTIAELGVFQGFPADHPWQAPHAAKQVGNAIPPPLAEACLRAIAG